MKQQSPTLHKLNWAFFWVLVLLLILFVAVLGVGELVGTKYQFFGPGSRSWASSKIQHGLATCSPDHVRILWFRRPPFTDQELCEVDLVGETVTYGGTMESPGWFESWNTVISVMHDGRSKLKPGQLAKIETIIDAMPDSNSSEPLEESLSVAINRHGKHQIYHYQFDGEESFASVPPPIATLCRAGTLGF